MEGGLSGAAHGRELSDLRSSGEAMDWERLCGLAELSFELVNGKSNF